MSFILQYVGSEVSYAVWNSLTAFAADANYLFGMCQYWVCTTTLFTLQSRLIVFHNACQFQTNDLLKTGTWWFWSLALDFHIGEFHLFSNQTCILTDIHLWE
jgi:hypothetical protein